MARIFLLVVLIAGCMTPTVDDPSPRRDAPEAPSTTDGPPPDGPPADGPPTTAPSTEDALSSTESPPATPAPSCTAHASWVEPGLYDAASRNASFASSLPQEWRTMDVRLHGHPNASLIAVTMQVFDDPAYHASDAFTHTYAGGGLDAKVQAAFDTEHNVSHSEVRAWAEDYAGNLSGLDEQALGQWVDGFMANHSRTAIVSEGAPPVDLYEADLVLDGIQAFYDARLPALAGGDDGVFIDGDWRWFVQWHALQWRTDDVSLVVGGDDQVFARAPGQDDQAFDPYLAGLLDSWQGPDSVQVLC